MFVHNVYAIYDSKAEGYSQPFFCINDAIAGRMFGDACNDESADISRHPEDYTLFKIGEWNSVEGKLSGCTPVAVRSGIKAVKPEVN